MKDYLDWLMDISNQYDNPYLCREMFNIEFEWILPRDEDVNEYGLFLRDDYRWHTHRDLPDSLPEHCTVLEAVIAMAKICVHKSGLPVTPERTCDFVDEIFDNIGVSPKYTKSANEYAAKHFLNRTYGPACEYCMFPSGYVEPTEMENIDILGQMNIWLKER